MAEYGAKTIFASLVTVVDILPVTSIATVLSLSQILEAIDSRILATAESIGCYK
ncbi:hypothetical protein [Nostoc sp. UIC 10630]|uniref:hypothetical protein n=1 Tax=Nostoc sp. UIC 10630 TaxID=2100146 RepID=UPI0013D6CBEB|nr:hypothetical protein [Nostoc sp. UIC 10630]NEU84036.1 hypothetical protein [Nostoc sp. UIC 10630]